MMITVSRNAVRRVETRLFEAIHKTNGIASVFLRVGENMRTVVIELDRAESEVGTQVVIDAAAEHPSRSRAAGAHVSAEVRNAKQSVDKEVQLVSAQRQLRPEENVVLARAHAAGLLVIAAQIGFHAEPV